MSIWTDTKGRLHVGIMVDGQRLHRIMPVGTAESQAKLTEAELRVAMAKTKRGKVVRVPGDIALSEVMALYIEHADTLRSPDTAKHHARRIGPWCAGKRASEAKQVAAKFIKDCRKDYAASTINWSLSCLKKGLELAFNEELTPVNYSDLVKTVKVSNNRDTTLTMGEAHRLSAALSAQARAVMWISLYTGCRRGEVLKMTKADIGKDTILIHAGNTKTEKTRTIPIVKPLRPWLKFVPIEINYEGVKSSWQRARVEAGLPHLNFHDLRRSCATMMIAAGVDLYVVSSLLGHSSVTVTQKRYGHLQIGRIADGLNKTFE